MRELIGVVLGFAFIPISNIVTKKKISIGLSICCAAVVMALIGGLGIKKFSTVVINLFTDISKLEQFVIVLEIGIIGHLMKKYGLMDKLISALLAIFSSPKGIMVSVPALVGLLQVPGGAIISAPFVQNLGDEYGVERTDCAIINLIFRHISMHLVPYGTGFLLATALVPGINIYRLIGLNAIFVVGYVLIGYFLYVHKLKITVTKKNAVKTNKLKQFGLFIVYASPIYAAILLNAFFKLTFSVALLANLAIIFAFNPNREYFKDLLQAINFKILFALIGVYIIQGVIGEFSELNIFFVSVFTNPNYILLGIIIASFFFGVSTGFQPTAIAIVLPIIAAIPMSEARFYLLAHSVFCWGFVGYFFSPLHLCQLFTCDYMGVNNTALYKRYYKMIFAIVAFLLVEYFTLSLIFV